jgi:hypothetical protein
MFDSQPFLEAEIAVWKSDRFQNLDMAASKKAIWTKQKNDF